MGRKALVRTSEYPYHVVSRANNRENFPLDLPELWPIFLKTLCEAKYRFDVEVECFVLMSNHYHLLIRTPDSNLDQIMHFLNLKLSQRIAISSARINRIFGSRYKWSLIKYNRYYSNVYRYIYQNPMRAQLSKRIQDYPYSSFNPSCSKFGLRDSRLNKELIDYINDPISLEESLEIKRGLLKTEYSAVVARSY